nr:hypothetical protein [Janthinobacterium sp. Marseille]
MTPQDFALLGIDAETILQVWGWGFASVIFAWFLGYCVGVAIDMIRKA